MTEAVNAGDPVLDDDGLLRHAGRWVVIPGAQLPVVQLLVTNHDRIVPSEEVVSAHAAAGGSTSPAAMEKLVGRIRARLATVGLNLHTIRQRGLLLEVPPARSANRPTAESGRTTCSTS